jgi:uncharacterized protein YndB with AHSA1/START domain
MTQSHVHASPAVQVRRTFNAPADLVFKAWIDPSMMSQWFARAPGTAPGVVIHNDPRPGGVYVVDVVGPEDGLTYRIQGRYTDVQPPARLAFTWWHDRADYGPSLVTIELRAVGSNATEVVLTHEQLPARMEDAHRKGWEECFDMLGRLVGS